MTDKPEASTRCSFEFKSEACGIQSEAIECGKTTSDCEAHGNIERFGGFPEIPKAATKPTTRRTFNLSVDIPQHISAESTEEAKFVGAFLKMIQENIKIGGRRIELSGESGEVMGEAWFAEVEDSFMKPQPREFWENTP